MVKNAKRVLGKPFSSQITYVLLGAILVGLATGFIVGALGGLLTEQWRDFLRFTRL